MPAWLSNPLAPAWAQAIFAGLAIIGAVAVTAWQRSSAARDAHTEQMRQEREHLKRLTIGLKAEILAALQTVNAQQDALRQTLTQLAAARDRGAVIAATGPIRPGSMAITDETIYRQVAADIGRLPAGVIKWLVRFYGYAAQVRRLTEAAPQAVEAYKILSENGCRLRLAAELALRVLDKLEEAGFSTVVDIQVTPVEIKELAAKTGYPLEELARERGFLV